jgi:fructokinase
MNEAESKNHPPRKTRRVFAVGETVWDIIFKNGVPLAAKPGGSMLNTAVSLGRAGIPVSFISEIGDDEPGRLIFNFLSDNHVSVDHVQRYSAGKTPVALAFLDDDNNADYSFYKQYPKQRLTMGFPEVTGDDIVLFGSFYAITGEIHESLMRFIRYARSQKALILYDPNFRRPHLDKLGSLLPMIHENISLADMVRGSDEDFLLIFGTGNSSSAYEVIKKAGCMNLLCTFNKTGVEIHSVNGHKSIPVPAIEPISTIGAGDAFNAGVIHALSQLGIYPDDLPGLTGREWEKIARTGIRFASEVCLSLDNYVSPGFLNTLSDVQ